MIIQNLATIIFCGCQTAFAVHCLGGTAIFVDEEVSITIYTLSQISERFQAGWTISVAFNITIIQVVMSLSASCAFGIQIVATIITELVSCMSNHVGGWVILITTSTQFQFVFFDTVEADFLNRGKKAMHSCIEIVNIM